MSEESYIFEERAGIMGKITVNIPMFKELCQMGKDSGFVWAFLDQYENIKKLKPIEQIKELLIISGRSEFVEKCDVLTRLSGIQGDTRQRSSMKGLREKIDNAKREHNL